MSTAFDLEDEFGLWPEAASPPEAGEGGTASGQKRPRFDEGQMIAGKKRCVEHAQGEVDDERRSEGGTASGQKRPRFYEGEMVSGKKRCVANVQEEVDDEQRSEGGKTAKTTASVDSKADDLPVVWRGKVPACAYCNKKADSKSPLQGSSFDDAHGGFLPWFNYTKYLEGVADDPTPFKKPTGDRCIPCSLSYVASGMSAQHGKITAYKANVILKNSDDNAALHKVFLEMRSTWILEYNREHLAKGLGSSSTASGKFSCWLSQSGNKKVKSRYVEVRKTTKTSIEGRAREFIEKEHWQEKLDGPYDAAKEVTEQIHGKARKGIWKWTGREGVWKGNTEEATTIADVHVEESGSGALVAHAAEVKAKALTEGLFGREAERDTHSVEAPVLGFDDLMAMAGFNADAPLLGTTGPGEKDDGEQDDDGQESDGTHSDCPDEQDSQDDHARVNSYFAAPGATSSGRSATKTVAQTASGQAAKLNSTSTAGKGKDDIGKAKGTGKGKAKGTGKGKGKDDIAGTKKTIGKKTAMRVDGRSERVRKALTDDLQRVADSLDEIGFSESFEGLLLTGDALKAFQQALTKKQQLIALQKKALAGCKRNVDRSKHQDSCEEEADVLTKLSERAKDLQAFVAFTSNPANVDWAAYKESFLNMSKRHELSKPYVLRALDAAHRAALIYEDDEAVCDTMKPTSAIGAALHLAVTGAELVEVVTAKMEAIILNLLKAYTKERNAKGKKVRDGSLTAGFADRLNVYKAFSELENSPAVQCLDPLCVVVSLVDPKNAKVKDLVYATHYMEDNKDDIKNALLGERLFTKRKTHVISL